MTENERNSQVMIVDDEEMVVTSVRALLQLETDFEIHAFTDPELAAAYADGNMVDVAVTDYLMPKMTGLQLLTRVKSAQPEASRVLLTGHSDKQSAIQAINRLALFQYLEKPWDNAQLLLAVQNGAERARLYRELRERVDELDGSHDTLKDMKRRLLEAFL